MNTITFTIAGLFVSNGKGRHLTRTMQSHELIFVKSGTLHIREGEQEFAVEAGQYLILHEGVEHGGTADYEKELSFFWGHFSCSGSELEKYRPYGKVLRPDYFSQYFTLLINEQNTPDNQRICDLLMEILLNETLRDKAPVIPVSKVPELAESARRIIDLKFSTGLSSSTVAKELGCSRDYLGKVFHSAMGCTMSQYINLKRCREAAYLLRTSLLSIKEIAFFCGFNDLPHFRRQFYQKYTVTPRQYRKVNRVGTVNTMNL